MRTLIRVSPGTGARVAERLAASGIFVTSSTTPNLYLAELPRPRLSIVTSDPDVVRVSLDAPVRALGTLSSLPQNLLLGTQALLPRTYTGKNIGVAVVDSGFLTSADLGNVTASYDFTSGKTVKAGPKDAFGHGTHVSGLIGSTGDTTRGLYQGIAPGVRFIVLKALDQAGVGYTSNVINAINFAVANKVAFGIDVMNLSLGHPIYEPAGNDPLVAAVERAVSAGIVVVVSAGNFGGDPVTHEVGYAGITSPGNAPDAITVGAVETFQTVTRRRRSGRVVQLPRPVLVRRLPETRRRGARITSRVERELGISAHQAVSEGRHSYVGHVRLDAPERHQHVGGRGQRRGGDDA